MDEKALVAARDQLLHTAVEYFSMEPGVAAVFLGGSLAAGSWDAYSDIDLRVVVYNAKHRDFVDRRRDIPKSWPGFLFNEWVPGTQHCVSHFQPFGKIDIFYYDADLLAPSPWYGLPITVLYDPAGVVASLIERSKGLNFTVTDDDVDFSVSKGIAAAHEAFRRAHRGELFYAMSLLDELRQHMMQADDWLNHRTPETAVMAKFEKRASSSVVELFEVSYVACEANMILKALSMLAQKYRDQVVALHEMYGLSRKRSVDEQALSLVCE